MNCQGCLKEIPTDLLCNKCRIELFDGEKINFQLDFASPENEDNKSLMENIKHISISGVQVKYSVKRHNGKLILTDSKGEYIVKPVPIGPFKNLDQAPANEHLTMQIARQVYKINTASSALVYLSDKVPAYFTRRFDVKSDGNRNQQEDFAQLAQISEHNAGNNFKYNASYETAAELIKKHVASYRVELEIYFKIVLFNYLFNNGDAHLKNFSVYLTEYGDYRLTPAYDLMNTKIHIEQDSDMALSDGLFKNDFETKSYIANGFYAFDDFLEFGKRIEISEKRTLKLINGFSDSQKDVKHLVSNSFLTEENKKKYYALFKDKLTAINYSFLNQKK